MSGPSPILEQDDPRIGRFIQGLARERAGKIPLMSYWEMFAIAFPHRSVHDERWLLRAVLNAAAASGAIRLPAEGSKLWDTSMRPKLPSVIFRVVDKPKPRPDAWGSYAWHPKLQWVLRVPTLIEEQQQLLHRVHDGLVAGDFAKYAPLRYRSLQLTGDEKKLIRMASSKTLFGPGRLTRELLGCIREPTPFAWASTGPSTRALAVENVGPFHVAVEILRAMVHPPYGIVIYGGGAAFRRSVRYTAYIGRPVSAVYYVGDLDPSGVRIAAAAAAAAIGRGVAPVFPAALAHRAMIDSAARFGHASGWKRQSGRVGEWSTAIQFLPADVRDDAARIFSAGKRIPEEVLGPDEWSAVMGAMPVTEE